MSDGNVDKLMKAGLIDHERMSDKDKKAVEALSDEEIEHLVATSHQVGADPGRTPSHKQYSGF